MKTNLKVLFTGMLVLMLVVSSTGTAQATLSGGSTFESGDGDLAPNTSTPPAPHDWNFPVEPINCGTTIPFAGTNCGTDLVKNQADNALGQGSKEDDPAPTVVSGSIPPSKDDLSRFYVNKEKVGGNDYLYLAWERSNLLGSAHMDFEFNQSSTPSANGVTPVRTAGDLLIDFDFGGSGVPVLAKHTWITSGTPSTDCEVSNTLPCWNKAVILGSNAEAAVNSAPVTDTNPPNAPFTLAGNTKNGINSTFGEAGINLTGSGIFPQNQCVHFGSAYLKSRSSGNSFGSELKDFIAPLPVNISNCGTIIIRKQTNPDGAPGTFSFTHDVDGNSNPVVSSPFSLSDNGEQDFFDVLAGTYHFTEAATTGFDFDSISCTVTGSGGSNTSSSGPALTITLAVGDTVDCTFNNTQRGTIIVKKVTDPSPDASNTSFSFTAGGGLSPTSFSLMNGGMQTYSNVVPGSGYSAAETVPAGWDLTSATCDDGSLVSNISVSPGETVTCTFNDRARGALQITKTAKNKNAEGGSAPLAGVVFTIQGVGDTPATDANGVTCVDNLVPGSYTIHEKSAPTGYATAADQTVNVTGGSTCSSGTPTTASFVNVPLSRITVSFQSLAGSGVTTATVQCTGEGSPSPLPEGTPKTLDDLIPGTYTCTIVIDP